MFLREVTFPPIWLKGYDIFSVRWFVSLDVCDPEISTLAVIYTL